MTSATSRMVVAGWSSATVAKPPARSMAPDPDVNEVVDEDVAVISLSPTPISPLRPSSPSEAPSRAVPEVSPSEWLLGNHVECWP